MIEHHWEPSSILPCCHDRNSSRHSRHVVTSSSSSSSTNNNNDNNKTFHASRHSRRQQRSKSTTRRRGSCCHRHSSGKTTGHAKWLTSIMSLLFLILSIGMDPVEAAFHGIRMEYKPPVKSSVRKLLSNDPRSGAFSSSPSSSTSTSFTQGSSSSPTFHRNTGSNGKSKRRSEQPAAHVGYYAPTMPSTNTQQNSSAQRVRNVRLSFEQRMRQLVLGTRDVKGTTLDTTNTSARGSSSSSTSPPSSSATSTTTTTTTTLSNFKTETTATTTPAFSQPKSKRMAAKNVHHIETLSEFQQIVGNEQERIVVVRFYATYCKACQAVTPHFYHLAVQYPHVVFVDVPVTARNTVLHQGLQVPSLPYAHIYHPQQGLVTESRLTRKHVAQFRDAIELQWQNLKNQQYQ